jgi:hypothetical protein
MDHQNPLDDLPMTHFERLENTFTALGCKPLDNSRLARLIGRPYPSFGLYHSANVTISDQYDFIMNIMTVRVVAAHESGVQKIKFLQVPNRVIDDSESFRSTLKALVEDPATFVDFDRAADARSILWPTEAAT